MFKEKILKSPDGTIVHYLIYDDGTKKMHNFNGPAYIPQGQKNKAEYYIFGLKYSEEDFNYLKKNKEGIPEAKKFETAGGRD